FAAEAMPDLDQARLANRHLMEAIFRLAWLREASGLVPVNWRDMETEELGSVYESLLELTPRLIDDGHGLAFAEPARPRAMPASPPAATTRRIAWCRRCSIPRSTRCSTASRRRPTIRVRRSFPLPCSTLPAAPAISFSRRRGGSRRAWRVPVPVASPR